MSSTVSESFKHPPYEWYLVLTDIPKNVSYRREIKREDADKLKSLASQNPQVRFQSPLYKFVGLYLRYLELGDSVEDSNNKAVTLINNFNILYRFISTDKLIFWNTSC